MFNRFTDIVEAAFIVTLCVAFTGGLGFIICSLFKTVYAI